MPDNCLDINLHKNSGTSQGQRMLNALSVDYAKVDERGIADLLLFAKKYGSYLNYYDEKNELTSDWSNFMAKDISVLIAYIQNWEREARDGINYINDLYDEIKSGTNVQTNFKYIFDFTFSFINSLDGVVKQLPGDSEYELFLNSAIASKLSIPATQLYVYYSFFLTTVLSGFSLSTTDPQAPFADMIPVPSDQPTFQAVFNFINNAPWILPANIIIPPPSVFAGDNIFDITTNNFFTGAVTSFLNGVINIVNQTGAYLEKTIRDYPNHEPHYALYLAFLRLFKFAQDHLNKYTERHLKFYYKKVLQLKNDLGMPDTAHLVFSLQKNIDQHLVAQGSRFKAGKDANNHDLFYALTNDIVVNQANIQALKSLYVVKNYKNGTTTIPQQLFASPVVNSADGHGGKLTNADKSWYPFGDLTNSDFVTKSVAEIGFAIASNILFLNEGTRTVTITFNCDPTGNSVLTALSGTLPANIFSVKFTGNKKLFDALDYPPDVGSGVVAKTNAALNQFIITIILNGNAPPIVPYSQKIHGGSFTQALPMVKVSMLDHSYYAAFKFLKIVSIDIGVAVDSVKILSLQNDEGKLDPAKPFKPFGEFAEDGAAFIIGSKEMFQKKLDSLTIALPWQTAPLAGTTINTIALSEGQWSTAHILNSAIAIDPVSTNPPTSEISFTPAKLALVPQAVPDFSPNEMYGVASINGFIKIQLIGSQYSLSQYLSNVQASVKNTSVAITNSYDSSHHLIGSSFTVNPPAQVTLPPSPVAQSISIAYSADDTIGFNETTIDNFNLRPHFFYHIEPFGFREMHPFLFNSPVETNIALGDNMLHLLPVFNMDNDVQDSSDKGNLSGHNNEGELWIGLSNTKPGEAHSVLFQVSEGSSNPLKKTTKISWFYMSSGNWISMDPTTQIIDQTNNLSESGLVIFNLPGDETINHTRADNNLLWIKGVVKNDTDAICKLIAVQANAAKAKFIIDPGNKIFFSANIPAGTISKPAVADTALKQTKQPYSSFGGVGIESNLQFNQRVSERLRHKHRAVSAWDYERLVLQNFPEIHKVKCLNHTSLKSKTQDYSEMKPGDVMIVTVPDLTHAAGANPLLPFTNVGLLEEIKKFIKRLCSPFVHVHVCNPQFEAIQFDFDVYFANDNSNSSYYTEVLNTDIQKFLMPWAFGSATRDIEFGGKIEKSVVLNFVQGRPYVDFVTCFKMLKYVYQEDGTFSSPTADADEAIASTARSILVPYPENNISPTANCKCNG